MKGVLARWGDVAWQLRRLSFHHADIHQRHCNQTERSLTFLSILRLFRQGSKRDRLVLANRYESPADPSRNSLFDETRFHSIRSAAPDRNNNRGCNPRERERDLIVVTEREPVKISVYRPSWRGWLSLLFISPLPSGINIA